MNTFSIVFIVRAEFAPAFRRRWPGEESIAVFSTSDSLGALEAICARLPRMVALDPAFIKTARGAALIAHTKTDPRLTAVSVRVLTLDQSGYPIVLDERAKVAETAMLTASQSLDRCGTRHALRFSMQKPVTVLVNGERSQLIDLSLTGAQILAPVRLRPAESVRITLLDKLDKSVATRCRGVVAWVAAEQADGNVRYRAGLQFADTDPQILEAFCRHHSALPGPSNPEP